MPNTAPQTNGHGPFDIDGSPIGGLVLPGTAAPNNQAGVFGTVLITDPTSSDQATIPHVPTVAHTRWGELFVASGATINALTFTLTAFAGDTHLWCQGCYVTSFGLSALLGFAMAFTNWAEQGPNSFFIGSPSGTFFNWQFGFDQPILVSGTTLTATLSSATGTAPANLRMGMWGFSL